MFPLPAVFITFSCSPRWGGSLETTSQWMTWQFITFFSLSTQLVSTIILLSGRAGKSFLGAYLLHIEWSFRCINHAIHLIGSHFIVALQIPALMKTKRHIQQSRHDEDEITFEDLLLWFIHFFLSKHLLSYLRCLSHLIHRIHNSTESWHRDTVTIAHLCMFSLLYDTVHLLLEPSL